MKYKTENKNDRDIQPPEGLVVGFFIRILLSRLGATRRFCCRNSCKNTPT